MGGFSFLSLLCYVTNDIIMKIGKKEYGGGGAMKEMYASGGMLKALLKDPKQAEMARSILAEMGAKIPEYEEGGKTDPKKELEMMTGNYLRQALSDAGVGGKYAVGEDGNMSAGDYSELVSMAKKKGVYQDARMKAVDDFRKKYGQGEEK